MNKSKDFMDLGRVVIMYIAAILDKAFGGFDRVFITLLVFMSLDYFTGVLAAIKNRMLSSRIGAAGIFKKVGILCVISLTTIAGNNIFESNSLRDAIILYYISNEGISILENSIKLGVPIPQRLKNIFESIVDDGLNKQ